MRIRLTLDITRTPKPEPDEPEPPYVQDNGYAALERSDQPPIGFGPPKTFDPYPEQ